jgi:transcriptional regulator with XRE-family HTH domain
MTRPRTTLGGFLRARRNECQPEHVGLPRFAGRRVAGLRRDEVARVAGVSTEYYVRLEQGRVTTASAQVLTGLARALRLDAAGVEYLHRLAGLGPPRSIALFERPRDEIEQILRWWPTLPVYITDANLDVVAANELMETLTQGEFVEGKNVIVQTFSSAGRDKLERWHVFARKAVALFRYSADENSARYRAVVEALMTDPDFARIWELHEVSLPVPMDLSASMAGLGELSISVRNFSVPELHGYSVTLYDAAPGSPTETVFRDLAVSLGVVV